MSEIVERVARALFQRDVEEDICDGTWEDNPALHERIMADARAAIVAMREPTKEMIIVGNSAIDDGLDEGQDSYCSFTLPADCASDVFEAMIDAALGETESE